MEITGRITADARVNETKNNKKVVGFSIAINDSYKTKDGEQRKITTYVDCSFWRTANIAPYLKKGTLVTLYGRIGINIWQTRDSQPKASLSFYTLRIDFLGRAGTVAAERADTLTVTAQTGYSDIKKTCHFN